MEVLRKFFAPATTSEQWSLNVHDWMRSLTMAILTGVTEMGYEMFKADTFSFHWSTIGHAVGVATFAYLVKNFATPAAPKA